MTEYTIDNETLIAAVTATSEFGVYDAGVTNRYHKTTAAQIAAYAAAAVQPLANFRNLIDGGDFTTNPWQRGTSFTGIASTPTYTADRWFAVGGASSSISVSQTANTAVAGFSQSLVFGRASANANTAQINLGQVLESGDSIRMQGQPVTLSFWAAAGANFSASALTVQLVSAPAPTSPRPA